MMSLSDSPARQEHAAAPPGQACTWRSLQSTARLRLVRDCAGGGRPGLMALYQLKGQRRSTLSLLPLSTNKSKVE